MARCCCKPVLFLGSTLHILCAIGCATATITAIWAIHLYDPLSILTHQYFYIIPHVQHVTTYSRSKEKNNNDSNNDNGDLFTLNAFVGARKWILKWYIAIQFDHKLDICTGVYSPYVNLYKCKITKINEYIIYIYIYAYFIYTPKHVGFVLSQGPQPHSTVVLPYSGERQRSHTIHQCLINLCHHLWSQRDPGLFQGTTRMSTRTQGIN